MAYSVQDYISANLNEVELERRFKNLEPFVRIHVREYNDIQGAMNSIEYGQARLKEIQEKLDDLKLDMENIIIAIELKKARLI